MIPRVTETAEKEQNSPFQLELKTLVTGIRNKMEFKGDSFGAKEDFSLEEEIKRRHGPLIEVGGPTKGGFELVDYSNLVDKIFISNVYPGCPLYDSQTGKLLEYVGKIDFQADARSLPFGDSSIGGLFASYLPDEIREKVIYEAKRVLETGGLLIWQGGTEKDLKMAKKIGFTLMIYSKHFHECDNTYTWNVIWQK